MPFAALCEAVQGAGRRVIAVWVALPASVVDAAEGEGEGRDVSSTDHDARSLPLLSKPSLVEDGSCGNPDHKSPELACRVCKHMVMDRK